MTIYGYARVSKEKKITNGQSLEVQERMLKGYCDMKGLEHPVMFVEDGTSGSVPITERPEGSKLMSLLVTGDIIIVTKLDRAFRSALDALEVLKDLKAKGVQLHMLDLGGDVTADGISKLVFTILAAVAEDERDRIRRRIRDVKRDQAERGMYLGGIVPWGHNIVPLFDPEGKKVGAMLKADDAKLAHIETMKALAARGLSNRKIAAEMGQRGVPISFEKVRQLVQQAA